MSDPSETLLQRSRLGDAVLTLVTWEFHSNGDDLDRVSIEPSEFPIYEIKDDEQIFWQRTPVSTIAITDPGEREKVVAKRWGKSPS